MSDYEKLVGDSRDGDFVHEMQQMAGDDGFKNVSKIWFDQTLTFDAALELMAEENKTCHDVITEVGNVQIKVRDDESGISLVVDGVEVHPTAHSLRQLATWCDLSHGFVNQMTEDKTTPNGKTKYKRDAQDWQTLVTAFLNGSRRLERDKRMLFRLKTTAEGVELRSVASDKYDCVGNIWYIEVLKALLPNARLSHWKGDIDQIFGNVLIPDSIRVESDSEYGGMVSIGNSEIGIRRLSQKPSVFRAICMNGCIWGSKEGKNISKVHRGINTKELTLAIKKNIDEQIPLLPSIIDSFMDSRKREFHRDLLIPIFTNVALDVGLSRGVHGQAMKMLDLYKQHESDNLNLFGVVNGITRVGQEGSNELWVKCDEYAGDLVQYTDNQWNRMLANAKTVQPKDVEKVFGVCP